MRWTKKATQNRVAFVLFKKFGKFRFYKIVLSSGGFLNPPRLVGFHFARLIIAHANFHRIAVNFKVGKRACFGWLFRAALVGKEGGEDVRDFPSGKRLRLQALLCATAPWCGGENAVGGGFRYRCFFRRICLETDILKISVYFIYFS